MPQILLLSSKLKKCLEKLVAKRIIYKKKKSIKNGREESNSILFKVSIVHREIQIIHL